MHVKREVFCRRLVGRHVEEVWTACARFINIKAYRIFLQPGVDIMLVGERTPALGRKMCGGAVGLQCVGLGGQGLPSWRGLSLRAAVGAFVMAWLLLAGSGAFAQSLLSSVPPTHKIVDSRNVNLQTGHINFSRTDLTIGDPNAGGLSYSRDYDINFFNVDNFRDNVTGTINPASCPASMSSTNCYAVSIGGVSENFVDAGGGAFTPLGDAGGQLSLAGNLYTYTGKDGSIAI
jgi:hypothetical protein